MRDKSHDDAMSDLYQSDPELAMEVLNGVLEDGEPGELLVLLRQLTKAFGGMQNVAAESKLNPTQLYRTLSAKGNPSLSSLNAVLKVMGLRLAVKPIKTSAAGGKRRSSKAVA